MVHPCIRRCGTFLQPSVAHTCRMALTAGELVEYLKTFPPATPVVVDVNTDEGVYLLVDKDLTVTADQGPSDELPYEVVLIWDPEPGWVQRLLDRANESRAEFGLPPLGT
jgi:hypothetical protein